MRRFSFLLVLLTYVCACACNSPGDATTVAGDDEAASTAAPGPTVEERLQASAAGEDLAQLATLVGAWRVLVEEDRGGALAPLAEGRAEITLALSGRFLEWRTEVALLASTVHSRGLLGYDRERELFELHWISELSSAQRIARGRGDARRGGVTLETADLDPETGGVRRARTVLRIEDADAFTMRQDTWDPDLADWRRLASTRYERLSSAGGSSSARPPK